MNEEELNEVRLQLEAYRKTKIAYLSEEDQQFDFAKLQPVNDAEEN
jgi:hypothetical protein